MADEPVGEIPPLLDQADVRGWHASLDEFERKIVPHGVERGYSRDALLVTYWLNMLVGATRSIESALWCIARDDGSRDDDGEDDGDGWKEGSAS